MKLTQNQILSGIILTAIAFSIGGVIAYNNAEADLTNQEVNNIIQAWHDNNRHQFVSQKELTAAHEVINQAIAAPHIEIADNESKILLNRGSINELKIEIAKIKIQDSGTGTPSQGTITVTRDRECYELDDVVTFQGMATPSRQLTSSIYKDKSIFEATPTTQTQSNGAFSLFWVIPDDIDIGTYIAKLRDSGGKFGDTTVNVRNSC